jgi:DNA-binding winged helix-turn-helix (wHTH) protein
MESAKNSVNLAREPDFVLGPLTVSPSTCRLLVGDQEHRTEAKSMAVLVTLARAGGGTVTREDLIDACWEGRIVSDDAIARAIAKVRSLAKCTEPEAFTLETVPKVGYRLVAEGGVTVAQAPQPVADSVPSVVDVMPPPVAPAAPAMPVQTPAAPSSAVVVESIPAVSLPKGASPLTRYVPYAGVAAVAVLATFGAYSLIPDPKVAPPVVQATGWQDARSAGVLDALLNLDIARLRAYLSAGWHPDFSLDSHRGTALQSLMIVCERNRSHDKQAVVDVAKLLVAAGADPSTENQFGDTAFSIARCEKYCGPDHPVVAYLKSITPYPKVMPCKPPGT